VALITRPSPARAARDGGRIEVARLPVLPLFSARFPVLLPGPALGLAGLAAPLQPEVVVTTPASSRRAGSVPGTPGRAAPHCTSSTAQDTSGSAGAGDRLAPHRPRPGRWVIRRATHCVGVSGAVVDFLAHSAAGCGLLPNGVDLPTANGSAAAGYERPRCAPGSAWGQRAAGGLRGRVTADKGVLVLAEALAAYRLQLAVAGDGEGSASCAGCGLPARSTCWASWRRRRWRGCWPPPTFVHPSCCAEGLPSSILEAPPPGWPSWPRRGTARWSARLTTACWCRRATPPPCRRHGEAVDDPGLRQRLGAEPAAGLRAVRLGSDRRPAEAELQSLSRRLGQARPGLTAPRPGFDEAAGLVLPAPALGMVGPLHRRFALEPQVHAPPRQAARRHPGLQRGGAHPRRGDGGARPGGRRGAGGGTTARATPPPRRRGPAAPSWPPRRQPGVRLGAADRVPLRLRHGHDAVSSSTRWPARPGLDPPLIAALADHDVVVGSASSTPGPTAALSRRLGMTLFGAIASHLSGQR